MGTEAHAIVMGCTHGGVAVIRSLGRHRIPVIGLTYNRLEFGLASKYLREWHICPHPEDENAFVQYLLDHAPEWGGSLLIETNDYYARALSRHKDRLSKHYKLVSPDWRATEIFLEKNKTYTLAEQVGVPYPATFEPQSLAELDAIIDKLTFPVMIKPVLSHEFVSIFGTKLFILNTVAELRERFQKVLDAKQPVMITEVIPGTDYRTIERIELYINSQGDYSEFSCVKVRQTPPMFGVMRVGESVSPISDASKFAHLLLNAVDYRGYANVEFKRDPRDNQLKLMEVNIRQPRGGALAIAAGMDFPWLIYEDLILNKPACVNTYRHDQVYIEIISDFRDYLRRDPEKGLSRFFAPYAAGNKVYPYFSWDDPAPFIRQLAIRGRRGVQKITGTYQKINTLESNN